MVTSARDEKHRNKGKTSCNMEVFPLFRPVVAVFLFPFLCACY